MSIERGRVGIMIVGDKRANEEVEPPPDALHPLYHTRTVKCPLGSHNSHSESEMPTSTTSGRTAVPH